MIKTVVSGQWPIVSVYFLALGDFKYCQLTTGNWELNN